MAADRLKYRLIVSCGVGAVLCAMVLCSSGCGKDQRATLRSASAEVAVEARDTAEMADGCITERIRTAAARGQAENLAKRFRETLKEIVAFADAHGERDLAGSIAVLALDGQQQALLIAGDPTNKRFMRLRKDRLLAIASNASALAQED